MLMQTASDQSSRTSTALVQDDRSNIALPLKASPPHSATVFAHYTLSLTVTAQVERIG
jgi:hypothetical protein